MKLAIFLLILVVSLAAGAPQLFGTSFLATDQDVTASHGAHDAKRNASITNRGDSDEDSSDEENDDIATQLSDSLFSSRNNTSSGFGQSGFGFTFRLPSFFYSMIGSNEGSDALSVTRNRTASESGRPHTEGPQVISQSQGLFSGLGLGAIPLFSVTDTESSFTTASSRNNSHTPASSHISDSATPHATSAVTSPDSHRSSSSALGADLGLSTAKIPNSNSSSTSSSFSPSSHRTSLSNVNGTADTSLSSQGSEFNSSSNTAAIQKKHDILIDA